MRLIVGNCLIALLLLSTVFAAGETYYRFFYDTTDSFAFTLTTRRWHDRHVRLNGWGVRDDVEYRFAADRNRRRITILGDSFTVGHGVADIEDRFANRIRRARPDWEVHALANSGIHTGTEIERLETALQRGYAIDTVVLAYSLNDAPEMSESWRRTLKTLKAHFWTDNPFVRKSFFVNTLYFRYKRSRSPDMGGYYDSVRDHYAGDDWRALERLFEQLHSLVKVNGGELLVVVFPFFHAMAPDYVYRDLHEQVCEFWLARSVSCLDLSGVYRDLPGAKLVVNRYDAHPNALAHQLAADAMLEFIARAMSPSPRGDPDHRRGALAGPGTQAAITGTSNSLRPRVADRNSSDARDRSRLGCDTPPRSSAARGRPANSVRS